MGTFREGDEYTPEVREPSAWRTERTPALPLDSLTLARKAAEAAVNQKAEDVLILDVEALTTVCDCFVLASAATRVQTKDIALKIEKALEAEGVPKIRIQGREEGGWILLDYGSVVVHVFLRQEREFYDLESRWSEGTVVFDSRSPSSTLTTKTKEP